MCEFIKCIKFLRSTTIYYIASTNLKIIKSKCIKFLRSTTIYYIASKIIKDYKRVLQYIT